MEISAYDVKPTPQALLKRAIAWETITITRHGTPVARITPMTHAPVKVAPRAQRLYH